MKKTVFRWFTVFLTLIVMYGCYREGGVGPDENGSHKRGDIIEATQIGEFSLEYIGLILNTFQIELPIQLEHSVKVIKIVYQTVDHEGKGEVASGALFIPQTSGPFPMLSHHHGTVTNRYMVASVNPLYSPVGLISASIGYLTCEADYLGLGVSGIMHPYLHAESSALAVIDMIRASKNYCNDNNISFNGKLFLGGYSQGGYVTLAVQKQIEESYGDEFNITASAPMAGPYDLAGTMDTILQDTSYTHLLYIGYTLTAYDDIYGWNRLEEFFNPPYGEMMPELFDGTKTYFEITKELPDRLTQLLNQKFIDDCINGTEEDVIPALEENTLLDWSPVAPIRFFHGDSDDVVMYQNALTAVKNLKQNGAGSVELVTIPGGTHESAAVPAYIGMIEWFESFRNFEVMAERNKENIPLTHY